MIGVIEINIKRIIKDAFCLIKRNTVLSKICRSLCFVPVKSHKPYLSTILDRPAAYLKSAAFIYESFMCSSNSNPIEITASANIIG